MTLATTAQSLITIMPRYRDHRKVRLRADPTHHAQHGEVTAHTIDHGDVVEVRNSILKHKTTPTRSCAGSRSRARSCNPSPPSGLCLGGAAHHAPHHGAHPCAHESAHLFSMLADCFRQSWIARC